MALFERYSLRAKRVIFLANFIAVSERAGEITPEHILRGLLKEDPDILGIIVPGNTDLVERIEHALTSDVEAEIGRGESPYLPLSAEAKRVVAGAGLEQQRLGHKTIATQHLLLAIVTCYKTRQGWFGWLKRNEPSRVHRILESHGITAAVVESKVKEGIVTPTTTILLDPVIKLNAQLTSLAELLISKGLFTRAEFVNLLDRNDDPLNTKMIAASLIDALFQKGKLTADEKTRIEEAFPPSPTRTDEDPPKAHS